MRAAMIILCASMLAACGGSLCEDAAVLSAYQVEQEMCIRQADTKEAATACMLEVQKRYAPALKDLGEDLLETLVPSG